MALNCTYLMPTSPHAGRSEREALRVGGLLPLARLHFFLPSPLEGEGAHSAAKQRVRGRKGGALSAAPIVGNA